MIRHYDAPFKIKAWESFIFTLLGSWESKLEALTQTNRAVRTRRSGRRDPTGSNKPDSDSASRPSGETRSRVSAFSGFPWQSVHAQNFSRIQAACPAGESASP